MKKEIQAKIDELYEESKNVQKKILLNRLS